MKEKGVRVEKRGNIKHSTRIINGIILYCTVIKAKQEGRKRVGKKDHCFLSFHPSKGNNVSLRNSGGAEAGGQTDM